MTCTDIAVRFSRKNFNLIRKQSAKNGCAINNQPSNQKEALEMLLMALPDSMQELMLNYFELQTALKDDPTNQALQKQLVELKELVQRQYRGD